MLKRDMRRYLRKVARLLIAEAGDALLVLAFLFCELGFEQLLRGVGDPRIRWACLAARWVMRSSAIWSIGVRFVRRIRRCIECFRKSKRRQINARKNAKRRPGRPRAVETR